MTQQMVPNQRAAQSAAEEPPVEMAIAVPADVSRWGEAMKPSAEHVWTKVSGKDTAGGWSAWESIVPGRLGVPLHIHHNQDEWFWVLSGEFLFEVGGQLYPLAPGMSLLCPRMVPHRWQSVVDSVGRLLIVAQPAGRLEEFFERLSSLTPEQRQDIGQYKVLFAECDMEIVGPPMEGSTA